MSQSQGSEYDRLFYPFLFEGGQVNAEEVLAQVRQSALEKCSDTIGLRRATLERCQNEILSAGQAMGQAFQAGATLFAFGNGGSATDAQDLVADLILPAQKNWQALPALALTNDIAVVTAVANDVGFENVFSRQVIAFGRPGDIAFGISTSGTSKSVTSAFAQAKRQGMLVIGLAGYDGGQMARMPEVDYCIITPGEYIPRIQEAQATVYHALVEMVQFCLASMGVKTPLSVTNTGNRSKLE
jgi:D-sedoheptulose 7-phosphate isomerase